jgi:hypothetical protein
MTAWWPVGDLLLTPPYQNAGATEVNQLRFLFFGFGITEQESRSKRADESVMTTGDSSNKTATGFVSERFTVKAVALARHQEIIRPGFGRKQKPG